MKKGVEYTGIVTSINTDIIIDNDIPTILMTVFVFAFIQLSPFFKILF